MSEAVLYQSVLQKLGQLSPENLAELDAFLAVLVKKQTSWLLELVMILWRILKTIGGNKLKQGSFNRLTICWLGIIKIAS